MRFFIMARIGAVKLNFLRSFGVKTEWLRKAISFSKKAASTRMFAIVPILPTRPCRMTPFIASILKMACCNLLGRIYSETRMYTRN